MESTHKHVTTTLKLYENYNKLITTILIGNNVVNILSASLFTVLCVEWFGKNNGPQLSTLILTLIILVFGEITPKVIAQKYPEKFAIISTPLINILVIALTPLSAIFSGWTKFITSLLDKIIKTQDDIEIEEEIITMVEEAAAEGEMEDEKKDLIQNAIEFYESTVGDVYVPRINVVAVEHHMSMEEIGNVFKESSYSRLPVYEDTLDNIIGFISFKNFDPELENIDGIIQEIVCVTKNQKISDVLKEFQESQTHIAAVVGEYGEILGIVTLEDIMEELVGEIYDESDDVEKQVDKVNDNTFLIIGNAELNLVSEIINSEIQSEGNTLNGWLMEQLERLPKIGDTIAYKDCIFEVQEMEDRTVRKVQITKST